MDTIKKGDIVGRKSYGKDILFTVTRMVESQKEKIAILKGLYERIEADSPISDLEIVEKHDVKEQLKITEKEIDDRIGKISNILNNKRTKEKILTGKILHLDGDKRYSQKSYMYYKKMRLNSVVKNIPEYRQPKEVLKLLQFYNPDILIITGHDGMIKKEREYNNIYNYRNSKYFVETVKTARMYDMQNNNNLVIFAGACQSFYEAIMLAGANFASSPARILIDFIDPLIVAQKIALTDNYKYITINDIYKELRDGKRGIDGTGAQGKMQKIKM